MEIYEVLIGQMIIKDSLLYEANPFYQELRVSLLFFYSIQSEEVS
jgi:hypothetical protein